MGTRLSLGSEEVTACLEEKKFSLLTPTIKMKAALIVLCVAVVFTLHADAYFSWWGKWAKGKKDTRDSARDEISRLVKTLKFYDELKMEDEKMKMEEVADDGHPDAMEEGADDGHPKVSKIQQAPGGSFKFVYPPIYPPSVYSVVKDAEVADARLKKRGAV